MAFFPASIAVCEKMKVFRQNRAVEDFHWGLPGSNNRGCAVFAPLSLWFPLS
jgi:hypothetical protein